MRVVHVCVTDKGNGADMAAFQLHTGLLQEGVDSTIFLANQVEDFWDNTKRMYRRPEHGLSRLQTGLYRRWIAHELSRYKNRQTDQPFISDRSADGRHAISQLPPADVIYIQSAYGFIASEDLPLLARRAQIVIILHDLSSFTGGCTHDRGCGRFVDRCGACPLLMSNKEHDLSRRAWERKRAAFSRIHDRLHFVAPSRWVAREAKRSSLLRNAPVEIIPNSVDTELFRPGSQSAMREFFGLPREARVVGFLSDPLDRVLKGFSLLIKALQAMKDTPNLFLLTGGRGKPPLDIRIPHLHLGRIYDSRLLRAFYSAADIVTIPSLNDNFPSVAMEAMACGTPTVAFATGGVPEIVRHGVSGLLVPVADTEALREGIVELLRDSSARARMAENGRKIAVEEYSMRVQAKRHAELCARIVSLPVPSMKSRPLPEPSQVDRSPLSEYGRGNHEATSR